MTGKKPDWVLKYRHKSNHQIKGKIGAAWNNDDGSISIRIDPFIALQVNEDYTVRLFPNDGKFDKEFKDEAEGTSRSTGNNAQGKKDQDVDDVDDDIPF